MPGFYIGEVLVPWYGCMIAIGIVTGGAIGCFLIWKQGMSVVNFIMLMLYIFLSGFAGAKLLYLWVAREAIAWERIFEKEYLRMLLQSGFVFYGGLAGSIAALFAVKRIHKFDTFQYAKAALPVLPVIHGFGRIGCHLAGCCYGRPYDGIFAVTYQEAVAAPLGVPLFPVQITEGICNLLLGTGMTLFLLKTKNKDWMPYIYLISYGTLRFLLEFMRYDDAERGIYGIFSTSQWISLVLVAGGLLLLLWKKSGKLSKLPF